MTAYVTSPVQIEVGHSPIGNPKMHHLPSLVALEGGEAVELGARAPTNSPSDDSKGSGSVSPATSPSAHDVSDGAQLQTPDKEFVVIDPCETPTSGRKPRRTISRKRLFRSDDDVLVHLAEFIEKERLGVEPVDEPPRRRRTAIKLFDSSAKPSDDGDDDFYK